MVIANKVTTEFMKGSSIACYWLTQEAINGWEILKLKLYVIKEPPNLW